MTAVFELKQADFHKRAAISYAVLGHGEDFILLSFEPGAWEADEAKRTAAIARGWYLCGVVGLTALNDPLVLCEPDVDCIGTMIIAAVEFVRQQVHRFVSKNTDWLTELWALQDHREDEGRDA